MQLGEDRKSEEKLTVRLPRLFQKEGEERTFTEEQKEEDFLSHRGPLLKALANR